MGLDAFLCHSGTTATSDTGLSEKWEDLTRKEGQQGWDLGTVGSAHLRHPLLRGLGGGQLLLQLGHRLLQRPDLPVTLQQL